MLFISCHTYYTYYRLRYSKRFLDNTFVLKLRQGQEFGWKFLGRCAALHGFQTSSFQGAGFWLGRSSQYQAAAGADRNALWPYLFGWHSVYGFEDAGRVLIMWRWEAIQIFIRLLACRVVHRICDGHAVGAWGLSFGWFHLNLISMIMDAVLRKGESLLYEYACAWVSESGAACVLLKLHPSNTATTRHFQNPQPPNTNICGRRLSQRFAWAAQSQRSRVMLFLRQIGGASEVSFPLESSLLIAIVAYKSQASQEQVNHVSRSIIVGIGRVATVWPYCHTGVRRCFAGGSLMPLLHMSVHVKKLPLGICKALLQEYLAWANLAGGGASDKMVSARAQPCPGVSFSVQAYFRLQTFHGLTNWVVKSYCKVFNLHPWQLQMNCLNSWSCGLWMMAKYGGSATGRQPLSRIRWFHAAGPHAIDSSVWCQMQDVQLSDSLGTS